MPLQPNSKVHLAGDTQSPEKPQTSITLEQKQYNHRAGETILETLQRNGIDTEFNCKEGFCGVCRTKLLKGSVEYNLDPLAFIDDDEILTCCTHPKGNIEIKIEY